MKPKRGQAGGRALFRARGPAHMAAIGKRGAAVFWRRYKLAPVGTSQFAIVRRADGAVVNFLDGAPWVRV